MNQLVRPPSVLAGPAFVPCLRTLCRFTVAQYHQMNDRGILPADVRTELLDGYIVTKMTPNPPHVTAVTLSHESLRKVLPEEWTLRVQQPLTLAESEPEPDIAAVRGPARAYRKRHPGPRDIGLVIEVSDSTLLSDRQDKGAIYARAKVPVYWIVNLIDEIIEVYTLPRGGKQPGYQQRRDYGRDARIPVEFAGRVFGEIAVKDLLP